LLSAGYPAEDLAGYVDGEQLAVALRSVSLAGQAFSLRHYQTAAVSAFYQVGMAKGGSGTIVLPCGAGKTMVGLAAIAAIQENTLILTSSLTSVRQWQREILDKTTLAAESIAEYSGENKATAPITLATYQILSYRAHKTDDFPHFKLFDARAWGLIIYDEVHLLKHLAEITGLPMVTGKTPQSERDRLYSGFRDGSISGLVLSRVGNFALDLPDADVLIQVSGKYGSRQEEAQRLGRLLRPKSDGRSAQFYTLVVRKILPDIDSCFCRSRAIVTALNRWRRK
jgi:superfamily II DNA or RNA helicase